MFMLAAARAPRSLPLLSVTRCDPLAPHATAGSDFELHEALEFSPKRRDPFCLFSIQFSPSNTHILGGSSDNCVYLYSLERCDETCRGGNVAPVGVIEVKSGAWRA